MKLAVKLLSYWPTGCHHFLTMPAHAGSREAVREQGFEGIVPKRSDSRYEPGRRSGAWQKMRVFQKGEFVISVRGSDFLRRVRKDHIEG
jgi:ATP-dependent DNA ligase